MHVNNSLYIQPVESVNWLLHILYTQSSFLKCKDIVKHYEQFSLNDNYHLYCLGLIHRSNGCIQESLNCFTKCSASNNNSPDILKQIARSLFLQGHHNEALNTYKDAHKLNQNDWEIQFGQGLCHFYMRQYDQAEEYFISSSILTRNIKPLKWLADVQLKKGSIDLAIETLKKATLLVPEDPDLQTTLGSLYLRINQEQLAFECLSSAILLQPNHFEANQLASSIITLHGDYNVALNKYRSIIRQASENSTLWNNIGVALLGKKKLVASITCFQRALYLTPFDWRISANLGLIYIQTSQWISGFHHLNTSIQLYNSVKQNSMCSMNQKISFDIGMLYCLLAYCFIMLKEYSKAHEAFMCAYKQNSKNPLVLLNYIIFLTKVDKNLANQIFDEYEKLVSTSEVSLPYWVNKNDMEKKVIQLKNYLGRSELKSTETSPTTVQTSL
uniref:TPR_REGION domain-containing protein n=2 Tax=Trichobilharzia regenti TaxID=157069 RepID=A0AA85K519_TRIRE|nr:unnamed protein product [Trichobilharzia regenti]